ncbi:YCF48-related protein [Candidatus Poribacteria bacterium]
MITEDGGKTWSKEAILGGCMFLSSDVGIILDGWSKVVHHTIDGGRTWESAGVEVAGGYRLEVEPFGFGDMFFAAPGEGWATGEKSAGFVNSIFHTSDGGISWEKQFHGEGDEDWAGYWIKDLFFLDSEVGWGCGRFTDEEGLWNVVLRTSDGGETWSYAKFIDDPEMPIIPSAGLSRIIFTNPKEGWAIGRYVFHTEDGGISWETVIKEWGYGIYFLNESQGWILGQKTLYSTMDAGETWEERSFDPPYVKTVVDLCFISENEGWIVGRWGVMHTRDGGEIWETQVPINADLYSVDFSSPRKGIAVGDEILATDDGLDWQAADWMGRPPDAYWELREVDFVDEQTGWVGLGSLLWKTEDGGKTWQEFDQERMLVNNQPVMKNSLCFTDKKNGWAVQDSIYFTTDGGETWDVDLQGGEGRPGIGGGPKGFMGVHFIDEMNGWVTTMFGDVYRTDDGGDKWERVGSLPGIIPDCCRGICFANEDEGWAIVSANRVYHTEDGGKRWHLDEIFLDTKLHDICYDGGEHLYVVGHYGIILRYTDPELNKGERAVAAEGKATIQWARLRSSEGMEEGGLPEKTKVYQNYPNPFNPDTWIPYQLSGSSRVSITICDLTGHTVKILDPGFREQGYYISQDRAAHWDGRNQQGEPVGSGVYFYQLAVNDSYSSTRKMIISR